MKYSVVIPAYNSPQELYNLCQAIERLFKEMNQTFEIIIVNDGGDLTTWDLLNEIYQDANYPISIIRLGKNYGQHNATLCGLKNTIGEFAITIDDDFQVDPLESEKLVQTMNSSNCDVVYGIYENRKNSALRNAGSAFVGTAAELGWNADRRGSSFRLLSRRIVDGLLEHNQNFIFIDEVIHWYTSSIAYVKVEYNSRVPHQSRYTFWKLVTLTLNLSVNYTTIPLRLISYLGITSSLLSFLMGLWFVYRKIFKNVPIGYTSVIVAVLFTAGLVLFSLGVLGQYMNKMYNIQIRKPGYSVQQKRSK